MFAPLINQQQFIDLTMMHCALRIEQTVLSPDICRHQLRCTAAVGTSHNVIFGSLSKVLAKCMLNYQLSRSVSWLLQEQRLVVLEWFKPALSADSVAELDYRKYTAPAQVNSTLHLH